MQQQTTTLGVQFDIFGGVETQVSKAPKTRRASVKQEVPIQPIHKPGVAIPSSSTVEEIEDGIIVRHHNASHHMPDHMLLMSSDYDAEKDDLLMKWGEEELQDLWDGVLTEHLKQLRQTKPGSSTREEILEWQESESFKELCAAIAYRPDDIRDGVLEAMDAYDFTAQTRDIIPMLVGLKQEVVAATQEAGLSRRECNSRRFKDLVADWFLSTLRKTKRGSAKWDKVLDLLYSEELRDLSSQIGLDISGVVNRVKPKLYFLQDCTHFDSIDSWKDLPLGNRAMFQASEKDVEESEKLDLNSFGSDDSDFTTSFDEVEHDFVNITSESSEYDY